MKTRLVWDWPVRISHWLMVVLFTGLVISGDQGGDWLAYHFYMGYALSALVIARILYGIFGSHYARFSQFIRSPNDIVSYLKGLLKGEPRHFTGHNPLGGVMVVALLLALTAQWVTGLFTSDQIFWFGPFNRYASDAWLARFSTIHHALPNILLGLVALHIVAVLYHELQLRERLTLSMVHGKKATRQESVSVTTPRWGGIFALLIALAWLAVLWMAPI